MTLAIDCWLALGAKAICAAKPRTRCTHYLWYALASSVQDRSHVLQELLSGQLWKAR